MAKKIYGIIGYPIKHTLSPAMHNAAFKALGIDNEYEYKAFEVAPEDFEGFLRGSIEVASIDGEVFRSADVAGFNVTIPHKVSVFEFFIEDAENELDGQVSIIGAVNTVKRSDARLVCRNTDSPGFVRSLRQDLGFDMAGKSALIFGCGGAGRAVVAGLIQKTMGIKKICLYDVNEEAVKSMKKHFQRFKDCFEDVNRLEFISKEKIGDKIKNSNLLINASPVGMKEGDGTVLDSSLLHENLWIYDLVYNRETQLIKDAKKKNLRVCGGLGMLLYQGVLALEFWIDKKLPIVVVDAMRKALVGALR